MAPRVISVRAQPKSGSTWLEVILIKLVQICCIGPCKFDHDIRRRHISMSTRSPPQNVSIYPWEAKHALPDGVGNSGDSVLLSKAAELVLQRCANVQFDWDISCFQSVGAIRTPLQVPSTNYILLLRDPRAVTISWLHYTKQDVKRFTSHAMSLIPLVRQIAAATSLRYVAHTVYSKYTLLLFYEDLLEDTFRWLSTLASYLGLLPTHEQMEALVSATTIEAMHAYEARGDLPGPNRPNSSNAKAREGKADSWRKDLNPVMVHNMTTAACAALIAPLTLRWCGGDASTSLQHPAQASGMADNQNHTPITHPA